MSKKLFLFVIAALFICWAAYGAVNYVPQPDSSGVIIESSTGQTAGTPITKTLKIRYAAQGVSYPSLASGDVVSWSTTSADGITISACVVSNDPLYAGVLVTPILTADSASKTGNERNWGYIATHGYVLARVNVGTTAGDSLVPSGGSLTTGGASFSTWTSEHSATGYTAQTMSHDIGTLLATPASNGAQAPVWLK